MQVPLNLFWFVFQMKSNRTENVENLKRKKDYRLNPNFKYEEGGSLPKAHWPTCLAVCLPMNFWNFSSTDTTGKLNLAFMFNRKQLGMLLWFSFDEIWQLSFSPYKSTISWCLYSLWFHRVLHFQNKGDKIIKSWRHVFSAIPGTKTRTGTISNFWRTPLLQECLLWFAKWPHVLNRSGLWF